MYNITFAQGVTSPAAFFTGVNNITNGTLGTLLLVLVWILASMMVYRANRDFELANLMGSFVSAVFGMFFWAVGWVNFITAFIPLVLFMMLIIVKVVNNK